ncbi:uncharacterized protein TRIADDRAFT_53168 [Trichoplax adhaerens]|uniref:Uncharacterized protein n=1 Tax=Trichoplax adhaerens TaxID=10228 RepID=B3RNH5_TRIAD|nr:hypothetical protein TRIADDRAFT_53168 [Trichoplax adhaerens]EDV27455.1 hypothetical protein TRIADDRAFT_53168 [Trichoplax adhaerens]|eukprot:XP_002109289.1 hypothetical protein TRIADDRAFT_53168 [Trichoplax adhaerens]
MDVEEKFFAVILEQSCVLFDQILERVGSIIGDKSADKSSEDVIESLQSLNDLLDVVKIPDEAADPVCDKMADICHHIMDISSVSCGMDIALVINTWKALHKIINKYKNLLEDRLEHDKIIFQLASIVSEKIQQCLNISKKRTVQTQGDPKEGFHILKIAKFFINLLLKFLKEFGDLVDTESSTEILFHLCLEAINAYRSNVLELDIQINQEVDTILSSLIEHLCTILVTTNIYPKLLSDRVADAEGLLISKCIMLIKTLLLVDTSTGNTLLLQTVNVNSTSPEIQRCKRECTLYEYVLDGCLQFVTGMTNHFLDTIEKCLFQQLLENADNFAFTIVSDILVHMSSSSNVVALKYSHLIANLIRELPTSSLSPYNKICWLLQRCYSCLTEGDQKQMVEIFDPEDISNLSVWRELTKSNISNPLLLEIHQRIYPLCLKCCKLWISDKSRDNGCILDCMMYLNNMNRHLYIMNSMDQNEITELVYDIWQSLMKQAYKVNYRVLTMLIYLTGSCVSSLSHSHLLEILTVIIKVIESNNYLGLNLCVADFIGCCGKKSLYGNYQEKISRILSAIYCNLMLSKDWLVHDRALYAFKNFAEITPHTDMVQNCVPNTLKDAVVDFLNSTPYKREKFKMMEDDVVKLFALTKKSTERYDKRKLTFDFAGDTNKRRKGDTIGDDYLATLRKENNLSSVDEQVIEASSKILQNIFGSIEKLMMFYQEENVDIELQKLQLQSLYGYISTLVKG